MSCRHSICTVDICFSILSKFCVDFLSCRQTSFVVDKSLCIVDIKFILSTITLSFRHLTISLYFDSQLSTILSICCRQSFKLSCRHSSSVSCRQVNPCFRNKSSLVDNQYLLSTVSLCCRQSLYSCRQFLQTVLSTIQLILVDNFPNRFDTFILFRFCPDFL